MVSNVMRLTSSYHTAQYEVHWWSVQ